MLSIRADANDFTYKIFSAQKFRDAIESFVLKIRYNDVLLTKKKHKN